MDAVFKLRPARPNTVMSRKLILASSSPYRKQLLARLSVPFTALAPAVDERARDREEPAPLSLRLAHAKALAVARREPQAVVVGSDQCAALGGRIVGKPGCRERAAAQLRAASGHGLDFYTAVRVLVPGERRVLEHVDHTRVWFRTLDDGEIERYLDRDRPFDCAGAFRVESLGIGLFSRIESQDPTALIGLPLIALADLLRQAGFAVP